MNPPPDLFHLRLHNYQFRSNPPHPLLYPPRRIRFQDLQVLPQELIRQIQLPLQVSVSLLSLPH